MLRILGLIVLGFALAVGVGFVATPRHAVAPTETLPTPVTTEHKETATETPAPTTTPEEEPKTNAEVPPAKPAVAPTPKVDAFAPGSPEYDKALQEALSVIAKLDAAKQASTTPPASRSLNDLVREAVVNILCTSQLGATISSVSASGVIIDPRGVILTNSHVTQYFLLKNYPVPNFLTCIVRTGSPAYPAYTTELLFAPPSWIADNAQKIDDNLPTGNGEHDWALLRITGSANMNATLPSSFPYLSLETTEPATGDDALVVGYAAGFLGGVEIVKNLYAVSSYIKVHDLYSYNGTSVDIFSLGGSVVAQQGSSGGAAVDGSGKLVGLVVTSTTAPDTASRDLKAITTPYIIRDFESERGISLSDFLSRDLVKEAAAFNLGTAPTLTQALVNVLSQ
jgi:S1-C subfamily serine protease